ncbi:hypothetical protein GW952_31600 (plasmid) [Klebsiella michiganensis]|uniref:Uncharacterized protein n=1 Tax=Klebsiella michiganensis TaxID=1134687 RepID=A0A6P1V623_9ENTR|nr:hypothetical protein GW952_31600 [Klebsiella michiganensis]HDX8940982.1 hypothetical protein [Klebsiella michiganensis]
MKRIHGCQRVFLLAYTVWYAFDIKNGGVLSYTFGSRNDKLAVNCYLLTPFNTCMVTI